MYLFILAICLALIVALVAVKAVENELIKFAKINAGESVEFVISYITKDNDYESLDSVVEILSSLAENDYEMINKEYKSIVTVNLNNKL